MRFGKRATMKLTVLILLSALHLTECFQAPISPQSIASNQGSRVQVHSSSSSSFSSDTNLPPNDDISRRSVLAQGLALGAVLTGMPSMSNAAVGSLPEFQDSNAIVQGLTIRVADKSQQEAMISFLSDGFDFQVLRQRINGGIEEVWMGFGPEQTSIPDDFTIPVSSFARYGGHASICVLYDPTLTSALYRTGNDAPGTNIAYLQVGVPAYRISQMVKSGGKVLDAYGIVNVVSPSGLPMRGIVGISPDPIMFVAINCESVSKSKAFYEQLGFVEQEYPFARPNKGMGQFEPPQPPKSVYMAPSQNCMGVLLLPSRKKPVVNPVVESLNIVYTPSSGASPDDVIAPFSDPSGVSIAFQSAAAFEAEEKITR
mmetsp:Transcript_5252/g.11098  ORF Transcript_5252/g.11098 Transcript_5252/m.11098 type:complete len:371 (-) Transcript_5252:1550-2662(-)